MLDNLGIKEIVPLNGFINVEMSTWNQLEDSSVVKNTKLKDQSMKEEEKKEEKREDF